MWSEPGTSVSEVVLPESMSHVNQAFAWVFIAFNTHSLHRLDIALAAITFYYSHRRIDVFSASFPTVNPNSCDLYAFLWRYTSMVMA